MSPEKFTKHLEKIVNLDVRSLYPTAQTKEQPVLNPLLFSTCLKKDSELLEDHSAMRKKGVVCLNGPCHAVRRSARLNEKQDLFLQPVNHYATPYHRYQEFYAVQDFIRREIEPRLKQGHELESVAGASFVGKLDKESLRLVLIHQSGGIANIGGYFPDLLAVLRRKTPPTRIVFVYFYNG